MRTTQSLVHVRNLSVDFGQGDDVVHAVKRANFTIQKGETVAIVGESGSGKTVSALSILRLLPYPSASHPEGEIYFKGRNLLSATEAEMREIRGDQISIIFQEPMTSLNPLHTIEKQVGEIFEDAPRDERRAGACACAGTIGQGRDPRSGATTGVVSAPALGRPAAARNDRNGARQ